jgi:hypothetical protein
MDGNTSLQRCVTFDILLPYGCGDLALACANRKFLLMRCLSDDLVLGRTDWDVLCICIIHPDMNEKKSAENLLITLSCATWLIVSVTEIISRVENSNWTAKLGRDNNSTAKFAEGENERWEKKKKIFSMNSK